MVDFKKILENNKKFEEIATQITHIDLIAYEKQVSDNLPHPYNVIFKSMILRVYEAGQNQTVKPMKFIKITEIGIANGITEHTLYHDDMYGERIIITIFPYSHYFGDFRMFEGIQLHEMDEMLIEMAKTLTPIYERIVMSGGTRSRCSGV